MYILKKSLFYLIGMYLSLFSFTLNAKTILKIWSFSDELKTNGALAQYEKMYPNVQIKFSMFPLENYLTKLNTILQNPNNAPDIFFAEVSSVKMLVNSKYFLPLSDQKDIMVAQNDYVPYAWNLGVDEQGVLKALTWQATPGGFYYRRSYAKEYLGSADPKVVSQAISSWEQVIKTAKLINEKSKGKVKLISSSEGLFSLFKASRNKGYIVNNKFNLDPQFIEWMKIYKTLYSNNLTAKAKIFTPAWMNGMKEGIFGYYLPTWALHNLLKVYAPQTSGDWTLIPATQPFFGGGSWVGVYYKSKHKKEALNFIKMQALNPQYMKEWAQKTGDFISRVSIQKELANLTEPFLNNQSYYQFYAKEALKINASNLTKYDYNIDAFIQNEALQYANGTKNLNYVIEQIKKKVFNAYRIK